MKIKPLTPEHYPQLLDFIHQSDNADAQLFFIGALKNHTEGMRVFVRQNENRLLGAVALLPSLPPFAVPIILAAGKPDAAMLTQVAKDQPSPQMAIGPKSVLENLLKHWPTTWLPLIGRRDEVLLKQLSPFSTALSPGLVTRLASSEDEATLVDYRIQMEKDSSVKLVSSREQATQTVRQLTQRQTLYVIEVDGRLGGCVALTSQDEHYEQLGFIFVEAQYRLRGVSDKLLSDVCTSIHHRQRKPLTFTCVNGPLRNRLDKIGFSVAGEHLKLYFGH